jgi:hypothetical protein
MGWDVVGNRRYYTRSRKVNGRVVRQYVGGGVVGELAAAADARRRAERQAAKEARQAEDDRWRQGLAVLQELCGTADLFMRAALLAADYHQHARSCWRRRRHESHGRKTANGSGNPAAVAKAGSAGGTG